MLHPSIAAISLLQRGLNRAKVVLIPVSTTAIVISVGTSWGLLGCQASSPTTSASPMTSPMVQTTTTATSSETNQTPPAASPANPTSPPHRSGTQVRVAKLQTNLAPQVVAIATPSESAEADRTKQDGAKDKAEPGQNHRAEIFLLEDTGQTLKLTARPAEVTPQTEPIRALQATIEQVINAPNSAQGASNAIPKGTKLLAVTIDRDGIKLNLSKEFAQGGGTASMTGRLGQILYTATSLDPTARVWLAIEGKPLTVLGGEGVDVAQPLTRAEFANQLSRNPRDE